MNASLSIAKTGLEAQDMRMRVISNNLANVNTTGFKRDRAAFETLTYQNMRQVGAPNGGDTQLAVGLATGTGVRVMGTERIHAQGNLSVTTNALDLAVEGNGFFQVLKPDGTTAYTRDGAFTADGTGRIVTRDGLPLQPAISVPKATPTSRSRPRAPLARPRRGRASRPKSARSSWRSSSTRPGCNPRAIIC